MKIKDTEITLRYKNRAIYLWESTMNVQNAQDGTPMRRFKLETQYDEDVYLYCLVITNNKDLDITFEEFADWLETHPEARVEFIDFLKRQDIKQDEFTVDTTGKEEEKKSNSQ